jgi:hypothetical protein
MGQLPHTHTSARRSTVLGWPRQQLLGAFYRRPARRGPGSLHDRSRPRRAGHAAPAPARQRGPRRHRRRLGAEQPAAGTAARRILGTGRGAGPAEPDRREVVAATLEAVDVEAALRASGLSDRRLRTVWERLLEPARPGTRGRPRATGSSSGRRSGDGVAELAEEAALAVGVAPGEQPPGALVVQDTAGVAADVGVAEQEGVPVQGIGGRAGCRRPGSGCRPRRPRPGGPACQVHRSVEEAWPRKPRPSLGP